jgi:hypothetical protein
VLIYNEYLNRVSHNKRKQLNENHFCQNKIIISEY